MDTFGIKYNWYLWAGINKIEILNYLQYCHDQRDYCKYGNNYYNSAGWLEITINVGAQQVYSSFFGSDNDFRPSFGYSYILPAGLASTIGLSKNSLAWNTGTGPTIYANSLKFGI